MRPTLVLLCLLTACAVAGCIDAAGAACEPRTCASLAVGTCGTSVDDGCGGTLDCSDCGAGRACVEELCVCTAPATCDTEGPLRCGLVRGACGDEVDCGGCPFGTTCGTEGVCGAPCRDATDCVQAGACEADRGFCITADQRCDGERCGAFPVTFVQGAAADSGALISCGCDEGLRCDDGASSCACEPELEVVQACAGRCGEHELCDGTRVTCGTCAAGACDLTSQRCRLGTRPAEWGEAVELSMPPEWNDVRSVAVVREEGELRLFLGRQGADGRRLLYRAGLSEDRHRLVTTTLTPVATTPDTLTYGFDSAPSLSGDGRELLVAVSRWPGPGQLWRYTRRADGTFEPMGAVGPTNRWFTTVTRLFDDDTLFAAGPRFLLELYGAPTAAGTTELRERPRAWLVDDPSFPADPPPEPVDDEVTGLQPGCDGLSLTFDWMLGEQAPGTYGVVDVATGSSVPVAIPIPAGVAGAAGGVAVSEVPGCSGVFVVAEQRLFYAPAP